MSAIEVALKRIKQNQPACTDSERSIKAIESVESQHPILNKIQDLTRAWKENNAIPNTRPQVKQEIKKLPKKYQQWYLDFTHTTVLSI